MRHPAIAPTVALFLTCASMWMFADTLWFLRADAALTEKRVREQTLIQIGTREPCVAEVSLEAWQALNRMGVYKWVVACENARPEEKQE